MRYLLIAAAFHLALTITIFLIGHHQLLPNTFDQNGIGVSFAIDGATYQKIGTVLVEDWDAYGFRIWLRARVPFHSKLYSLTFATFGRVLGHNILAAEALNLLYYLGILSCIYYLGSEVFNARTGLIAAALVGLWPSFLLHSTQLIRDPLAILCFLALMILLVLLLTREFSWSKSIALAVAGVLVVTVFWVTRGNMWNSVLVAVFLGIVMLLVRMVREKRFMAGNAIVILAIVVATLLVPTRLESTTLPGIRPPATHLAIPSSSAPQESRGVWTRVISQIADRRAGFRFSSSRASDIDADVRFAGIGDMLRFLPRAAVIGFFAPFPNMWMQAGSFGFAGRLLSGLETLAMYFLYLAVGFCLWRERRNTRMWLLFLVAAVGLIALGLVVVNAGALYRIRYVFWIMLIVIAVEGLSHFTVLRTNATKS